MFTAQKRFEEALASYDRAIALKPDYSEALGNRGYILKELKLFEEALASYDRAIALDPGYASGIRNRALCRLLIGDYRGGWRDYQARWEAKDFPAKRPNVNAPNWQGESLRGFRIPVFFA